MCDYVHGLWLLKSTLKKIIYTIQTNLFRWSNESDSVVLSTIFDVPTKVSFAASTIVVVSTTCFLMKRAMLLAQQNCSLKIDIIHITLELYQWTLTKESQLIRWHSKSQQSYTYKVNNYFYLITYHSLCWKKTFKLLISYHLQLTFHGFVKFSQ